VLRVVNLGERYTRRQRERLPGRVGSMGGKRRGRVATPLDGDLPRRGGRQRDDESRRSHGGRIERCRAAGHLRQADGAGRQDEGQWNGLGQAARDLVGVHRTFAAPDEIQVRMFERSLAPFPRESGTNGERAADEVRLEAEEAFGEGARGNADGVAGISLGLLPVSIERGGHVEVAGRQPHKQGVEQIALEQDRPQPAAHLTCRHRQRSGASRPET
jgi:hypothetical protein